MREENLGFLHALKKLEENGDFFSRKKSVKKDPLPRIGRGPKTLIFKLKLDNIFF